MSDEPMMTTEEASRVILAHHHGITIEEAGRRLEASRRGSVFGRFYDSLNIYGRIAVWGVTIVVGVIFWSLVALAMAMAGALVVGTTMNVALEFWPYTLPVATGVTGFLAGRWWEKTHP